MAALLLKFALSAVSILIVSVVMPGMKVRSFFDAFGFAIVVAILDVIAWKLLAPLTYTFGVLTLGVGFFIVNGLIFLVAQKIARGVEISGCFVATIAAILVGLVNSAIMHLIK